MKSRRVVGGIAVAVVLIVAGLLGLGQAIHELRPRALPLTVAKLDEMAAKWEEDSQQTSIPGASSDAGASSAAPEAAEALKLQRALTRQELSSQVMTTPKAPNSLARTRVRVVGALLRSVAEVSGGIGGSQAGYLCYEAGADAFYAGHYDEAGEQFRRALNYPLSPKYRTYCCLYLACLDGDPEIATRLLELATANDDPFALGKAAKIAEVTGSGALREHYQARLDRGSVPQTPGANGVPAN